MSGNEIKKRIEENDLIIESQQKEMFILNEKVAKALEENRALRALCPHEYENGVCIYCRKEEEK